MTFTLRGRHSASGRHADLEKRTAARFLHQCFVVIPLATILPGTVVKCKAALIGGGADCTTRSHSTANIRLQLQIF